MARSRETKIELTAYDDLFQTDESREEAKLSKIRDIPISEIDEFPDHPFKVLMDEDMEQLVESIDKMVYVQYLLLIGCMVAAYIADLFLLDRASPPRSRRAAAASGK